MVQALTEIAWGQWARLGVSGAPGGPREERAADPEALLVFTFTVARSDPRLFDETLDWLSLNESLVSAHRLRNLCATPAQRALIDGALAWVADARRPERRRQSTPRWGYEGALVPLFPEVAAARELDPSFAGHGFARPPMTASGRSRRPRMEDPVAFALRLRGLLGVGARAEVVRVLLTVRAPMLSTAAITESACFAQRNVREALQHLVEAGVVRSFGRARGYAASPAGWVALLGLSTPADLPLHYEWIAALRAFGRIAEWLMDPQTAGLSPYLTASALGELVESVAADLLRVGILAPDAREFVAATDPWSLFEGMVRHAIRAVASSPAT